MQDRRKKSSGLAPWINNEALREKGGNVKNEHAGKHRSNWGDAELDCLPLYEAPEKRYVKQHERDGLRGLQQNIAPGFEDDIPHSKEIDWRRRHPRSDQRCKGRNIEQ